MGVESAMPPYIRNVNRTLRLSLRMARSFLDEDGALHREGLRLSRHIIEAARRDYDGAISTRVYKKVQWYMAHALWMGQLFGDLLGRKLDESERKRYVYGGALGALSDILVDDMDVADERLRHIIDDPGRFGADHPVEHLFQTFYSALMDTLPAEVKTNRTDLLNKIMRAQLHSKKQFDPTLKAGEVDQIVKEKGALSVCAYRGLIREDVGELEHQAMYELGALIQYINDVNDLYKDGKQGIRTFATVRDSLEEMALEVDRQKTRSFRLIKALPYEKTRKENFMFVFYALVVGTSTSLLHYARVCDFSYSLDALLRLDKAAVTPKPFNARVLARAVPSLLQFSYGRADRPVSFQHALSKR